MEDSTVPGPMEYWMTRDPEHRRDRPRQRFYVACCLLMSSVQDWLLGLKEKEGKNFNWSATCSYFAMVHAARLLCFLAHGDFPTSHAAMARFLCGRPGRSSMNWLRDFSLEGIEQKCLDRQAHDDLLEFLQRLGIREGQRRLKSFGELLDGGRGLRNDSNYEALLIAHEYHHHGDTPLGAQHTRYPPGHHRYPVDLTDAFGKLADCMSEAAERGMELGIETFIAFMDCDPSLGRERDALRGFFCEFVVKRVREAIDHKLGGNHRCVAELEKVVDKLLSSKRIRGDFSDVVRSIHQEVFGLKQSLMARFAGKVDRLKVTLRQCPELGEER